MSRSPVLGGGVLEKSSNYKGHYFHWCQGHSKEIFVNVDDPRGRCQPPTATNQQPPTANPHQPPTPIHQPQPTADRQSPPFEVERVP